MRRRLRALLAMAMTLTLGLALIRFQPRATHPPLTSSPAPAPAKAAVAFFGFAADTWCGELYDELEDYCGAKEVALTSYDCFSDDSIQAGQLEEFLRLEEDGVVVIYPAAPGADWDSRIKALQMAGHRVITIGQELNTTRQVACHVGVTNAALTAAAGTYLRGERVLLLPDLLDDPRTEPLREALEKEGIPILDQGITWGGESFGQYWLEGALAVHPDATALVAYSRTGVLSALDTELTTLCLNWSDEVLDDLRAGRLDAAVTVAPRQIRATVRQGLEQVLNRQRPGLLELEPVVVTADTLTELGFEE